VPAPKNKKGKYGHAVKRQHGFFAGNARIAVLPAATGVELGAFLKANVAAPLRVSPDYPDHRSGVPCPTTPADRERCSCRLLPCRTRPSPFLSRVGIRNFTFEIPWRVGAYRLRVATPTHFGADHECHG
jgi:hypothetical protein